MKKVSFQILFGHATDAILSFFGEDYWKMCDDELLGLAEKYNLLSEMDLESISFNNDIGNVNPNYERNLLTQSDRQTVIKSLIERTKYSVNYISIIFSTIAIVISVVSLFVK